jgi:hypothetical protein
MNLGKAMVEAEKGDPVHMIKVIKDQIYLLKKADTVKARPLKIGHSRPPISTDLHTQQLVHMEAGREA